MDKKKKEHEYGTLEHVEDLGKQYSDMTYDSFKQGEEYSGLKKGYERSGQKAMKDTIGQMAAKTGGMASSYAQTAGQQAYGDWMSRLEDAAYEMYGAQKADKLTEYNLAQDAYKNRKAVADEEELKANELKTQNENKLWMKFALGELTPGTMSEADYASYGLTPEEAQTVYDDWLYQSTDKRKAEAEETEAKKQSNFYRDLALGKFNITSNGTISDADFADLGFTPGTFGEKYGMSYDDARYILAQLNTASEETAAEDEYAPFDIDYYDTVMDKLTDPETTAEYKEDYIEWLYKSKYITEEDRDRYIEDYVNTTERWRPIATTN